MGFGGSDSGSTFSTQQFPGAFGAGTDSARLATTLEQLLGNQGFSSPYAAPLQSALLNPQFGATTSAESALLQSVADQAQGTSAVRGLGAATPGGLAQAIAPTLVNLRQNEIGNLESALGQSMQGQLGMRGQTLQGLESLIGLSMPQVVGGQTGSGSAKDMTLMNQGVGTALGGILGGPPGAALGGAAASGIK